MIPPSDKKPGAGPPAVPAKRGLSDEERERLGPPPGKKRRLDEQRRKLLLERRQRREESLQESIEQVESFRMPLMQHLVEMRDRLMWSTAALIIGVLISLFFAQDIYTFLQGPFLDSLAQHPDVDGGLALVHSPFESIYVLLRVALLGGVVMAMPVISWHMWQFVAPGLYSTEKSLVGPLTVSSTLLFMTGAGFCFYGIFPYAFPWLVGLLPGLDINISADGYLTSVTRMMLAFGLCFQLPVVAVFLARIGLIDHKDMWTSARYAIITIFMVAAFITPPDPMTQSLLAAPLILLYIISTGLAWMVTTKVRVDDDDEDWGDDDEWFGGTPAEDSEQPSGEPSAG